MRHGARCSHVGFAVFEPKTKTSASFPCRITLTTATMPHDHNHRGHSPAYDSRRSKPRSRSPYRTSRTSPSNRRSRSPDRVSTSHRIRSEHPKPVKLPFYAKEISKHDYKDFKPLLAVYLDVQKQLYIEDLDEREVKGRWKSFVGKWYVSCSSSQHVQHST